MATDVEWKARIGARIAELRDLKGWSLEDLARKTDDRLKKSRISNYEQAIRLPGPEEATILAEALGEAPAHILCLDDEMPALSKAEAKLIRDLRALPEYMRAEYLDKIAAMAMAHKLPLPNDRLLETGYDPKRRPKQASPKKVGPHDQ